MSSARRWPRRPPESRQMCSRWGSTFLLACYGVAPLALRSDSSTQDVTADRSPVSPVSHFYAFTVSRILLHGVYLPAISAAYLDKLQVWWSLQTHEHCKASRSTIYNSCDLQGAQTLLKFVDFTRFLAPLRCRAVTKQMHRPSYAAWK